VYAHERDEEESVTTGGFSSKRLTRVRDLLHRHVDAGDVPGAVAVIARHGEAHIETAGMLAFEGTGSKTPMAADTICRMGSMTKPFVAACAMTLVEDGSLRLDDPVDAFLPELADMTVLADPNGPLEDTVPANRPITLRDLLTFTFGTGMVIVEPGTVPIADALAEVDREPDPEPDEWMRGLGSLPLVHHPGEYWMYEVAANVTVEMRFMFMIVSPVVLRPRRSRMRATAEVVRTRASLQSPSRVVERSEIERRFRRGAGGVL